MNREYYNVTVTNEMVVTVSLMGRAIEMFISFLLYLNLQSNKQCHFCILNDILSIDFLWLSAVEDDGVLESRTMAGETLRCVWVKYHKPYRQNMLYKRNKL